MNTIGFSSFCKPMQPSWCTPPEQLILPASEVHLWRVSLDYPPLPQAYLAQTLAPDERERAERFYFAKDRDAFIVGRGYLRVILSRYLATEPSMLRFTYGSTGKPALDGEPSTSGICFNVSHSQTLALYAIAWRREVGVDVEHIRQVKKGLQIAQRYFSPREYAALMSLPPHEQNVAFLNAWTRKEAFVKAYGTGLADALDGVEVTLLPNKPAALLHVAGENAKHWGMVALAPTAGYVGALVAEGRDWQVRQWG